MLCVENGILMDEMGTPAIPSIHPPIVGSDQDQIDAYLAVARGRHEPPAGLAGEAVTYPLYEAGERAHVGLCLAVRMLREAGWAGRVQLWHVGDVPDLAGYDVELVDIRTIARGGSHAAWAAKSFALQHCGLEKALVCDWDCYCVENPQRIFSALDRCQMVWWGPNAQQHVNWDLYSRLGLSSAIDPVQGGFLAYNCRTFWHGIQLQRCYDEAAAWWWPRVQSGDEGGWRLVLNILRPQAMQERIAWLDPAWVNSFDGRACAVHRCNGKLWPDAMPRWNLALPKEARVIELYRELVGPERYRRLVLRPDPTVGRRSRPRHGVAWRFGVAAPGVSPRLERPSLMML